MGLNHISKLWWFTRFEIAFRMDESNSERILKGPLNGEAPAEVKHVDYRKKRGSNIQERALPSEKVTARSTNAGTRASSHPERPIWRTAKTTIADARNSTRNSL